MLPKQILPPVRAKASAYGLHIVDQSHRWHPFISACPSVSWFTTVSILKARVFASNRDDSSTKLSF
jgi:hypothetical protein